MLDICSNEIKFSILKRYLTKKYVLSAWVLLWMDNMQLAFHKRHAAQYVGILIS